MGNKITKAIDKKTLDIFVSLTRKKAKEEIAKYQNKLTRKLTNEEKHLITKKVAKRTRGKAAVISIFALGIFTGMKTDNLLEASKSKGIDNKEEITIDAEELNKDISIDNVTNDREIFINGIKVELNEIENNEKALSNVKEQINNLSNPEESLEYLKESYVNEYNKENDEKITKDNVTFHIGDGNVLYSDQAENGDTIVRKCTEYEYREMGNIGLPGDYKKRVIEVTIKIDENKQTERFTYEDGKYVHVYEKDEQVRSDYQTTATKMGKVLNYGLNYYSVLENKEKNSWEDVQEAKQDFIDSILEYKQLEDVKDNFENLLQTENQDLDLND